MRVTINNRNCETKDLSLGVVIFFAVIGIIPVIIGYLVATEAIIPELKTKDWDDATGTVISAVTNDTGRTRTVSTGKHSSKTVRVYNSIINFRYEDGGQTFTKTSEKEIEEGSGVKKFHEKYYEGAVIELKINPQDRSNVIVKPNYTESTIALIACAVIGLAFFLVFSVAVPLSHLRVKKAMKDPSALRHKFEAQGFRNIDYRDVEQPSSIRDDDVKWTRAGNSFANGFTFNISKTESSLSVKRNQGCIYIFLSLFLIVGIVILTQDLRVGIFWCLLTLGIILIFLFSNNGRVFDKLKGYYWKGKNFNSTNDLISNKPKDLTPLSQIKALQVLYFYESGKNGGNCYELNLILKDNKRINVFSEGNLKEVLKLAEQISEFLNIRVILDPKIDKESYIAAL